MGLYNSRAVGSNLVQQHTKTECDTLLRAGRNHPASQTLSPKGFWAFGSRAKPKLLS